MRLNWYIFRAKKKLRNLFARLFRRKPLRFNVKDFGAVGDGEADDTDAIHEAVRRAEAAGGGEVYFPPGVFYHKQPPEP